MSRARRAAEPEMSREGTVPVIVAKSRPFAAACLKEWRRRDGIDRGWMLHNNSIDVPADVVEAASETLRRATRHD